MVIGGGGKVGGWIGNVGKVMVGGGWIGNVGKVIVGGGWTMVGGCKLMVIGGGGKIGG